MKNRIQYIDIAKGLTILLVIVGHVDTLNVLFKEAIYSFHMPLFFLLSGFFINVQASVTMSAKKMLKTLIMPYLLVGGIISLLQILVNNATLQTELLKLVLVICKYNGQTISIGPLWFLTALFLGKLWVLSIYKSKYFYTYIIIGALLSLLFTKFTHTIIPFTMQHALTCAPFLCIGMKLREYKVFDFKISTQLLIMLAISLGIFSPLVSLAMFSNSLTPFNYITATTLSIVLIYSIIKITDSQNVGVLFVSKFLSWCGRYSLIILALHSIEEELHLLSFSHELVLLEIIIRCLFAVIGTWILIKINIVRKIFCV